MKPKIPTHVFLLCMIIQLFIGCVTLKKYPSSWPAKNEVNSASQLSCIYNAALLQILDGFMQLPYVPDAGSFKVQLLLDDTLQYEVRAVPVSAALNSDGTIIGRTKKILSLGPTTINGFHVKKTFRAKKGSESAPMRLKRTDQ